MAALGAYPHRCAGYRCRRTSTRSWRPSTGVPAWIRAGRGTSWRGSAAGCCSWSPSSTASRARRRVGSERPWMRATRSACWPPTHAPLGSIQPGCATRVRRSARASPSAAPNERIVHRDPIARLGPPAIKAMEVWLATGIRGTCHRGRRFVGLADRGIGGAPSRARAFGSSGRRRRGGVTRTGLSSAQGGPRLTDSPHPLTS